MRFLGDDPANTAPRVGDIAQEARYQMEMEVGDGLACGWAVIDADVIAIWPVRLIHHGFGLVEQFQQARTLSRAHLKERADMSSRNDEAMPG